MKKLIFCPHGIYRDVYDILDEKPFNDISNDFYFASCGSGYENELEDIKELKDGAIVVTAIPTFLCHEDLWYDHEKCKWEVYMVVWKGKKKKKPTLVNIHDLTDKEIRLAHNIEKLYLSGGFGELWK